MGDGSNSCVGVATAVAERPAPGLPVLAKVLLAGFIPGSTLALLLLGYGYSHAVSAQFGVDAERIAGSVSDYLQLSAYAVLFMFTRLSDLLGSWETYRRLYADLGWGLVIAAVALLVLGWWVFHHRTVGNTGTQKGAQGVQCSACACKKWFVAGGALLGVILSPAFMLMAVLILMLLIGLAYILIPSLGFAIGLTALHELVVKPEHCVSLRTRQQRMTPPLTGQDRKDGENFVHCVALKKDGKEIARGRLVLATSQGVLLFHPGTGHVLHMSGAEVSLHSVDSLEQPAGAEQRL